MKRLRFLIFCFLLINAYSFSCNLSDLTLLSITGTGPYTTTVRLCVGYGRTGATSGSDGATRTIAFGIYRAGGITVSSFLPADITSPRGFALCTMSGVDIGAQGPPFNSDATIMYVDPGYYGVAPCVTQPFCCNTTTALCGNVAQGCINFTFVTNNCWDSIRVFGVEGDGNPVAGCMPNPDMILAGCLTALPLFWDDISAEVVNGNTAVKINWSTFSETNNSFFTVQRSASHHATVFDNIGTMPGTNTTTHKDYSIIDYEPIEGVSYYRVKQTDYDGATSHSRMIPVHFYQDAPIELKIYPNPAWGLLNVEAQNLKRISIFSILGQKVFDLNAPVNGLNIIDAAAFTSGLYILKAEEISGVITNHKVEIFH